MKRLPCFGWLGGAALVALGLALAATANGYYVVVIGQIALLLSLIHI